MDQFAKCAVLSTACDAAFVSVAAAILMYAFSYDPALAFKLGAFTALLFCVSMIHRLSALQQRGVHQTGARSNRMSCRLAHRRGATHKTGWKKYCCALPKARRECPPLCSDARY